MSRDTPEAQLRAGARFAVALTVITGAGLLVRLAFQLAYAPSVQPLDDGLWYHVSANLLADGHGLIDPLAWFFRGESHPSAGHPPLFVVALGIVSKFGGTSLLAHQLTQLAIGSLVVPVVGLLGRAVAAPRAGLIAAGLTAAYPPFWASQGDMYSESLYALTIAAMLLAAYRLQDHPTWRRALVLGAATALTALCRGEALLFFPFLVLPLALRVPESWKQGGLLVAAAAAGAFLVLAPVTIYQATRLEDPVLVSTGLGPVVAGSNCDATYANGRDLGSWNIECSVHDVRGDESERSTALRRIGVDYALDHLDRLPVVIAARVGRTFEVYRVSPNTNGPEWVQTLMAGAWYVLVAASVGGAITLHRRRVTLFPLLVTVAVVAVSVALTWGTPRFRVPVDIVVLVLAAAAVDAWWPPRKAPDDAPAAEIDGVSRP